MNFINQYRHNVTHEQKRQHDGSIHSRNRSTVILVGGLNGREWLTIAAVIKFIFDFLTVGNPEEKLFRTAFDWLFIPMANPDGYEQSMKNNRTWDTNACPYACGTCQEGVHLNTNFPYKWGLFRTSKEHDSVGNHVGPWPMSEREVESLVRFIGNLDKTGQPPLALFNIFGHGNLWQIPNSDGTHPRFWHDMRRVAKESVTEIFKSIIQPFASYQIGNTRQLAIKDSSGTLEDWAIHIGIPYAYRITVPEGVKGGYEADENDIEKSGLILNIGITTAIDRMNVSSRAKTFDLLGK